MLDDADKLKAMPVGSLGHEYSKFLVETSRSTSQLRMTPRSEARSPLSQRLTATSSGIEISMI